MEQQYLDLLANILKTGQLRKDRTGINTIGLFGAQERYNITKSFPAITTKKLAWKAVVSELLWFLEGSTDERRLAEILYEKPREQLTNKTTIWTANANADIPHLSHYVNDDTQKNLGPIYGWQWRSNHDQLSELINGLQTNPYSRRHILSAWNPQALHFMKLPPCHLLAQFYVHDGMLSCHMYQRSADMFLGVPFNIASYSLLTYILAEICNLKPGEFIHSIGDAHIYLNHIEQVKEQLSRKPYDAPILEMPKLTDLDDLLKTKTSDYKLINYKHHSAIKADMAV